MGNPHAFSLWKSTPVRWHARRGSCSVARPWMALIFECVCPIRLYAPAGAYQKRVLRPQALEPCKNGAASRIVHRMVEARWARGVVFRCAGVSLHDNTFIALPAQWCDIWHGCGGSTRETAAVQVQGCLDLQEGLLVGPWRQARWESR